MTPLVVTKCNNKHYLRQRLTLRCHQYCLLCTFKDKCVVYSPPIYEKVIFIWIPTRSCENILLKIIKLNVISSDIALATDIDMGLVARKS